ncbi:unnamed protein product [Rotaria sordida]|uniref:Uncharacterized protein n=1 Tax=Rotaria sordida TaxID=392033 RepID=A0A814A244_9BILA|nr:unnamed protein product [Rotaria sordida]CAF0838190.1 unnamed protein product [Rotaria sordida]CAF0899938.1 unnamed protein product [Rotaria sordida]CAF0906538.1 unnamed protein product [Rotaria sordida]CAF0922638.1 unnamed protein product [Rotaria sordida]
MKLWCLFVVFLMLTISTSFVYSIDSKIILNPSKNIKQTPSNLQLSSFVEKDRLFAKRSQRNANILYRYCRQSGQARQFCLKYAVQMLYATGH